MFINLVVVMGFVLVVVGCGSAPLVVAEDPDQPVVWQEARKQRNALQKQHDQITERIASQDAILSAPKEELAAREEARSAKEELRKLQNRIALLERAGPATARKVAGASSKEEAEEIDAEVAREAAKELAREAADNDEGGITQVKERTEDPLPPASPPGGGS